MLKPKRDERPTTPCERCGKPGTFVVWEHQVCAVCAGDWFRSPRLDELGKRTLAMTWEQSCREWSAAAAQWVARKEAA